MSHAIPQSVIDRYKRLVATYGPGVAAELAGISRNAGLKIRRRGYKAARLGVQEKPFPADFAVMANRMTKKELMRRYRIGHPTLILWLAKVDRDYKHQQPDRSFPAPPREDIEAALALGSIKAACRSLGVCKTTLMKWRVALGMPVATRRTDKIRQAEAIEAERQRQARRWGKPSAYRGPYQNRSHPAVSDWSAAA